MEKLLIPLLFLFHGILAQRGAGYPGYDSGCQCTGQLSQTMSVYTMGQSPFSEMATGSVRDRKCQLYRETRSSCDSLTLTSGCQLSREEQVVLRGAGYMCSQEGGRDIQSISTSACVTSMATFNEFQQSMISCTRSLGASLRGGFGQLCRAYQGTLSCLRQAGVAKCGQDFGRFFVKLTDAMIRPVLPVNLSQETCPTEPGTERSARENVDEMDKLTRRLVKLFA